MIYYFDGETFEEVRGVESTNNQHSFIESLIRNCTLEEERKCEIEREYLSYTDEEAAKVIDYLLSNQQHPIFDRASPTQTDIKNHIAKNILK
jgi:hypothetical protein